MRKRRAWLLAVLETLSARWTMADVGAAAAMEGEDGAEVEAASAWCVGARTRKGDWLAGGDMSAFLRVVVRVESCGCCGVEIVGQHLLQRLLCIESKAAMWTECR